MAVTVTQLAQKIPINQWVLPLKDKHPYIPTIFWRNYITATGDASGGVITLNTALKTANEDDTNHYVISVMFGEYSDSTARQFILNRTIAQWNSGSAFNQYLWIGSNVAGYCMSETTRLLKPIYIGVPIKTGTALLDVTIVTNVDTKVAKLYIAGYSFKEFPPFINSSLLNQ